MAPYLGPVCGAKRANSEERCQLPAGQGTPHPGRGPCKRHFGCTSRVSDSLVLEMAREEAIKAGLGEQGPGYRGSPIEIHPHEALLEEVRRTAGRVRWIGAKINSIVPGDLQENSTVLDKLALEYRQERHHLVNVCGVAARAGVEERQVQIAELWGTELAQVLSAILDDLKLTPAQKRIAATSTRQHLQLLEGTGAGVA